MRSAFEKLEKRRGAKNAVAEINVKEDEVITWMRFVCRFIYYCIGLGDCWYEKSPQSRLRKIGYAIWSFVILSTMIIIVTSEIAAVFREDLTEKEWFDAFQFSLAHTLILMKWACLAYNKNDVRVLLKKVLIESREFFIDEHIERKQVIMAKKYCLALAISVFAVVFFVSVDGFVNYFLTGNPWRTIVTYYPSQDNLSYLAFITRGFTTLMWYHLLTGMSASDFLCVTNLIYLSFKYQICQKYFRSLKTTFETNKMNKTLPELEDDMYNAFVKGIKLHRDIIWSASTIQQSLGNIYSFQLTQSLFMLIICFAKLVTLERTMSNFMSIMSFISVMLTLTGVYMWSAGEVTYQASLLSDAIFESGWHLCSGSKMRTVVVVSIIRSQVPVMMTAFGVVHLSYENFIKLIRSSYSYFAVLY